ncbi:unnamed protein product, partial [Porites lobata]
MSFESDTEQSDVESIGSRTHISETEPGSDEDEEDMYYSDPEGPYIDEPIVDEEWLTEYNRELEEIERRNQELQNRFGKCSCGNCALDRLQNPGECLCYKEIEKCVESLGSTAVLNEVEISPECITLHPGFSVVCLNRWFLRSAASKYKRIHGTKYRQTDTEEKFLRGVAYREFTQLVHGFLGGKRIPLTACAYHAIKTELSEENEEFFGFEDNE